MAIKAETQLWKKLQKATKDYVHWMRIESWALPGIPDLHGIINGKTFWVELKVHRLKSLNSLRLSPHQINWQVQYSGHGGVVWNLVSHPSSSTINLFSGNRALELGGLTEKEGPLTPDHKWKSRFPWTRIVDAMLTE